MRTLSLLASAVLALVLVACRAERLAIAPPPQTSAFIVHVATADGAVTATYSGDSVPPHAGGTVVAATIPPVVIVGGSSRITVSRAEAFSTVVFNVDGFLGWYELTLPAPATSVELVLTWSQEPPRLEFPVRTSAGTQVWTTTMVRAIRVGTGDVQVSVAFDSTADVDLYVTEPNGSTVYYAERESSTGGELDLDANAGCAIPQQPINNENIVWERGEAPRGEYVVHLDYFDSCGKQATNWVVTVHRRGQEPLVFTGRFTGTGTQGESLVEVVRFTY